MELNPPLISVIVPAYNAERYIEEAIQSIYNQAYKPLEVIVVDDGSTDGTCNIAGKFGESVTYIRQENGGPADAKNRGLKISKGDIIAFLDADDLWPDSKIHTQLAYFSKYPAVEVVMGLVQCLVLSETIESSCTFNEFGPPSLMIALGAGLYKRSVFEKLGNFDRKLQIGEDVDWFMRIRENGIPISIIDTVTLYYRFHKTNITRDRNIRNSFFLKAMKKSLDRRRLRGEGKVDNLPPLLLKAKN